MSKLEELLQGINVEFLFLGEICETVTDYVAAGSFAALKENVKYNDEKDYAQLIRTKDLKSNFSNKDFVYVSEHAFNFLWRVNLKEESIILPNIGNCGEVYYLAPNFLPYENNVLGPNAILLRSKKYNNVYLSYIFKSDFFQNQLVKITTPGGQSKFNKTELKKLKIPIPCPDNPEKSLEIQQEIVRVLDELTSLTNQLTTELETERQNRKKQFEFYREQLLSFKKGNVEWKTLGDIGNVKMCKRIFKNETKDFGDIPFYKIGTFGKTANAYISRELYEDYKEKYSYPNKGDILISAAGTIGRTVVFDGKPAYFQDSNIIWIENNQETIINEYLCHFYKVAKWYISGGGTIDRLYNDNVRKTKIPVPFPNDKEKSLAEQKRIVKLLDQFDATHTAIEEEITKEIKLRTQQYEYYREKLLSFPQN